MGNSKTKLSNISEVGGIYSLYFGFVWLPYLLGAKGIVGQIILGVLVIVLCLHAAVIGSFVARAQGVPLALFAAIGIGEAALMNPIFIKIQMRENMKNRKS